MGTKSIMDQVYDSIKCWVELGGICYVGKDHLIRRVDGDDIEMMEVGKDQLKPLRVFGDNMESGDFIVFNPYIETIGVAAEREWFFNLINMVIGMVTKRTIEEIINTAISDEEVDKYEKLSLISPLVKDIDAKTLKEFNAIGEINNFLEIVYNKRTKTSKLRCALFEEDFMATIPKMRKKSWRVFHTLMYSLLGTEDIAGEFSHKASIIGMPRGESFLTVAAKTLIAINDHSKLFLDKKFPVRELKRHIKNLNEYDKAKSGLVFTNAKSIAKNSKKVPAWKSAPKARLVPVGAMSSFAPAKKEYVISPEEAKQLRDTNFGRNVGFNQGFGNNNNMFNNGFNTPNIPMGHGFNNPSMPMGSTCNIPMVNTSKFKGFGGM